MQGKEVHSYYRPEIDGLRAIAVIAVIINHFMPKLLPNGYLGVDIFFVISGYVITLTMRKYEPKNLKSFLTGFYARRVKRLVPALLIYLIIMSCALALITPNTGVGLGYAKRALIGITNIELYRQSVDYFSASSELNPFMHTWSLGVEEQFYFVFPLLCWVSGYCLYKRNSDAYITTILSILGTSSFIFFAANYDNNQAASYFLIQGRFWEMALGCIAAIQFSKPGWLKKRSNQISPLTTVGLLLLVILSPVMHGYIATFTVVITTCLVIQSTENESQVKTLLCNKRIVFIGLLSYSLYLWHWGVLSISRWTIGIHWWSIPIQLTLVYVLAYGSYKYIEDPWRKRRWQKPYKGILGSLGLLAMGGVILHMLGRADLYTGSSITRRIVNPPADEIRSCNIFEEPKEAQDLSNLCGFGDIKKDTLYLIGDSHAEQFTQAAGNFAKNKGLSFRSIWGNSCIFPDTDHSLSSDQCLQAQKMLRRALIKSINPGDIVLVGNALRLWVDRDTQSNEHINKFKESFKTFSHSITSRGAKIVLYVDSIQFNSSLVWGEGELCLPQWFRPAWSIPEKCFTSLSGHKKIMDKNYGWRHKWSEGKMHFTLEAVVYNNSCIGDICRADHYADNNHFKDYYAAEHFKAYTEDPKSPFSLYITH